MSEVQPIVPLLVMWQRTLRIRQYMSQEQRLHESFDAQDMTTPQVHFPTTAEQTLALFVQQERTSEEKVEESDERLWWEDLVQETNWAEWKDDGEWKNWYKS